MLTVIELMYCMFFERYGDVVVPGTEYGTGTIVLEYVYSAGTSSLIHFDRRLKTANEKFFRDFVMVNIFYKQSGGHAITTTQLYAYTRVYNFVPRFYRGFGNYSATRNLQVY